METLILRSKNKEHLSILKAMAKALKVEIEVEESPYDPAFVKDILQAREDIRDGKGVKIGIKDLWK
jgi:hypothetical protein